MDKMITNGIIGIIYKFSKVITIVILLYHISVCSTLNKHGVIYIGEWATPGLKFAYPELKVGQHGFMTRNCSFVNCFYTTDHYYFNDIKSYDVLLFNARDFCSGSMSSAPSKEENQQYIFLGFEPASLCTIYETKVTFDLTWTYKLTSDIVRPPFIIKNMRNEIIGPRKNMNWDSKVENMPPLDAKVKHILKDKNYAAAYISSHCDENSPQQQFVAKLENELNKKGQVLHTYGGCGHMQCELKHESGKRVPKCAEVIRKDYYFFLAFEDALVEDYVTDKLLYALHGYAVPIVYGGANYTRFMPDGMYLNARYLGVEQLAKLIMEIINDDTPKYQDFFRWQQFYSYHDVTVDDEHHDGICDLCTLANNKTRRPANNLIRFWNVKS